MTILFKSLVHLFEGAKWWSEAFKRLTGIRSIADFGQEYFQVRRAMDSAFSLGLRSATVLVSRQRVQTRIIPATPKGCQREK
jgi:hypothetical protein